MKSAFVLRWSRVAVRRCAVAAFLCFAASSAHAAAPASARRIVDPSDFDTSVKPTDDFYQYVNGKWLARTTIPADQTGWSTGAELRERNQALLLELLERAARDRAARPGSATRLAGDFYASATDSARIEALGAKPLDVELGRIAMVKDRPTLRAALAHLQSIAVRVPFIANTQPDSKHSSEVLLQIVQGGLGLPDRDYYLKEDDASATLRAGYVAHVARMLGLLGDDPATATAGARTVLGMETALARASLTRVERRDPDASYHRVTIDSLAALAPALGWRDYFTAIGIDAPAYVNVAQPRFVALGDSLFANTPIEDWRVYLRWQLAHAAAPYLGEAFVREDFDFFGRTLTGAQSLRPRWKRAIETVDGSVGEALGQLYVAKAFPPAARARVRELVENLRAALHDRIDSLTWMSEATKRQAQEKLAAFQVKVGYPDAWRDYTGLVIARDDWFGNVVRSRAFETRRNWRKLGRPVDRGEWNMTPPTVNAYYNSRMNEIVFPAGILQPPNFDPGADDALNYGAIGTVIGHEMTHGFDDQGRKFDAAGNLRDWWTPEDAARYVVQSDRVRRQFDGYVAVDTLHINGRLTLGENTADLGGVAVAYAAMQKAFAKHGRPGPIDGLTPEQRFFVAYAMAWRSVQRPEALRLRIATDPHSPGRFRVLGPLSNLDEFRTAWGGKEGDPMVRPESERARIW